MKKIKLKKIIGTLALSLMLLSSLKTLSQDSLKTNIHLAPGVTHPIGKDTTNGVNTPMISSCDGSDIRIFPSPNPQSEIHISINKLNPNVLLLSSNTFPVTNSWQGAYWSTNGGGTWIGSDNLPNNAPGRGDPSTAFDAAGNGYIATMTYPAGNINAESNGYAIQRTTNNGTSWQPQVSGSGIINGLDKPMTAVDDIGSSPFANNFYCAWTNFNSSGRIQFNRSTNQGSTFSTPIYLSAGLGQGTNIQTGINGEVYVCWSDYAGNAPHDLSAKGLGFCRSTNGGVSFSSGQRVINYTGIRAYNAATNDEENPLFNMIRVNDFPCIAVDKSTGSHRGRIYVAVPLKENGNGKAIIQISWSDNQGITWNELKTISISNGRENWFPWITVDDTNGNIYVVYYSLDATTGFSTNTYVAISNDGGVTFINQRVSDVAHITAHISEFSLGYCGDYIGITSHGGKAYAAWTDNRVGQWQDYISQVSNADILGSDYICSGGSTFSISNLPSGGSVTWSISPATGVANLGCKTCNQTTLTKVANGTITLTATVSNVCGSASLVVNKIVSAGNPPPIATSNYNSNYGYSYVFNLTSQSAFLGPDHGNPGDNDVVFNNTVSDSRYSFFVWTPLSQPAGTSYVITNAGKTLWTYVTNPLINGSVGINMQLQATGPCGSYIQNITSTAIRIGTPQITVQPNPAQDFVTIRIDNSSLKNNSNNLMNAIKITDHFGRVRKIFNYKTGIASSKISLAEFNSGFYLVSVFDGHQWSSKQLVIQK